MSRKRKTSKSLFELHAQGVELDLPASQADAEVQAPAGDVVEGGDFLGEEDGVSVGKEKDEAVPSLTLDVTALAHSEHGHGVGTLDGL